MYEGGTTRVHIVHERVEFEGSGGELLGLELDHADSINYEKEFAQDLLLALKNQLSIANLEELIKVFQQELDEQNAQRANYISLKQQ